MRIDWWTFAKSSIKGKSDTQRTLVKCCQKMMPMIDQWTKLSRSRQWPNVAKNSDAPCQRTLSHCGLWPNVAQKVPFIKGLCHAADFDQMWPKMGPSLEDFVTQQTLIKCGPKCAPHRRTLSRSGLWPNVAQNVPLIGGLCLAADFNQMWPKMCPSLEDFVLQQTSIKCGPKCAPHWRTLSCSRLWPNVARNVPLIGGLCLAADFDWMWSKHLPFDRWLCFAMGFDHIWVDKVLIIKKGRYLANRF